MDFFQFLSWVVGLWNNIFSVLSKLTIGGASFTLIILAWGFLSLVIFRFLSSRG